MERAAARRGAPQVLVARLAADAETVALRELRAGFEDQELPVLRTVIPDRQGLARAAGARLDQRYIDLHADVLDEIIDAIKAETGTNRGRVGSTKGGVGLNLAIGIAARTSTGKRTSCTVELLGATLGESWPVLFDLVADITPGLIVVDGEEELSSLSAERFATVPRQRCLWHLSRAVVKLLRYKDRGSARIVDEAVANLETLLANAWAERDLAGALECLDLLADTIELDGGVAAATHLRNARDEVFTFLSSPTAGQLVTGHKGRPDVGTGVLERVMREMNRRSDVGVRWSTPESGPSS